MQSTAEEPDIAVDRWLARLLDTAPDKPFHIASGVASLTWIWALSVPRSHFLLGAFSVLAAFALLGYWIIRLIIWRFRPTRISSRRWWWIFPIMAVWLLVPATDASLRARFALGQSDFTAIIDGLEPVSESRRLVIEVPDRIGSYSIDSAFRIGDNVFFREGDGGFLDSGGFAYLPDGPGNLLLTEQELVSFDQFADDWYVWTSPWNV